MKRPGNYFWRYGLHAIGFVKRRRLSSDRGGHDFCDLRWAGGNGTMPASLTAVLRRGI